jgi:hypothetical protein
VRHALPLLLVATAALAGEPSIRLVDVAAERGLAFEHQTGRSPLRSLVETTGAGACVLDHDGDGDDDVYLVSGGVLEEGPGAPRRRPSRLFRNDGGRFVDVTEEAGVGGRGYGMGCTAADLDGDGATDLLVTNHGPDELFLNLGDGTFREAGAAAGLADPRWTTSAAAADHDGDGDLDLFVGAYADPERGPEACPGPGGRPILCRPSDYAALPSRLLRNDGPAGDGVPRFTDVTRALGASDAGGRLLGVLFEDLDEDGRPDLYLANDMSRNVLLIQRGGRFVDATALAGVGLSDRGLPEAGMGVDAGDLNGDGLLDLVVTNFEWESNTLYRGLGGARWVDESRSSGLGAATFLPLGFGVHLIDLDLDGDLDLFVANGHVDDRVSLRDERAAHAQSDQVFENPGPSRRLRLHDVSKSALAGAPLRVGRGSAWLDLEGDGDLDLVVNDNGGPPLLYENRTPRAGRSWLAVRLEQPGPNRSALGALVEARAEGLPVQRRRVRTACSLLSASPPRAHFGLGAARTASVSVTWPDGLVQDLGSLAAGRVHLVRRAPPPEEREP